MAYRNLCIDIAEELFKTDLTEKDVISNNIGQKIAFRQVVTSVNQCYAFIENRTKLCIQSENYSLFIFL